MKKQRRQTPVDHRFFEHWSRDMAYVLGYWFADGNISKPGNNFMYSFDLTSKDRPHLEKIRVLLKSEHSIYDKGDGSFRFVVGSRTIWQDIQRWGGTPAKSLTAKWPDVPILYLADFARGYIDGDGSLYWGKSGKSVCPCIRICGTIEFLSGMAKALELAAGIQAPRCYQYGSKVPQIQYTGIKAKALAYWLYTRSGVALDRKTEKAMSFVDWVPRKYGYKRRVVTPKMQEVFGEIL